MYREIEFMNNTMNLNVINSSNFVNIDISTTDYRGETQKVISLALPKDILKHTINFNSRLKSLLESHVKTNEKMKALKEGKKITAKSGKGKEYTIEKEQYKDAFNAEDAERLATWIIDSFVKSKYKPNIQAYITKAI
jgi:hypothetical protein